LVKQLVHFGLCVRHVLNFQPTLFHVHVDFIVQFESIDAGVDLVEQGADDARHDDELVLRQVDVCLNFSFSVQYL